MLWDMACLLSASSAAWRAVDIMALLGRFPKGGVHVRANERMGPDLPQSPNPLAGVATVKSLAGYTPCRPRVLIESSVALGFGFAAFPSFLRSSSNISR